MKTFSRQFVSAGIVAALAVVVVIALVMVGSGCKREAPEPETIQVPAGPAPEAHGDEHEAVPEEYASLVNPVAADDASIAAGKAVYDEYCVGCHGASGTGDGPKAATLDHTPADFTDPHMAEEMTDAAFFWRISEGVEDEDMPAWKDKLTEDERWQLVNFVRTFAPAETAKYSCPMHPEQTSDEPGECAECGMDLVPAAEAGEATDAEDGESREEESAEQEHAGHDHD